MALSWSCLPPAPTTTRKKKVVQEFITGKNPSVVAKKYLEEINDLHLGRNLWKLNINQGFRNFRSLNELRWLC